jgi:hypothetical protein
MARKYGKKASEKVEQTMREWKRGTLRSSSGEKVTSREQAIAIGLSQARRSGYKVPPSPIHHATKKSTAQLEREIAESLGGKQIDRRKLGEMMGPWGGDFAYGAGTGAIGAVGSYYSSGMKYPERKWVERAIQAIEADVPKAEHGAHGWTKSDARDLRRIAAGLRYYLHLDYKE